MRNVLLYLFFTFSISAFAQSFRVEPTLENFNWAMSIDQPTADQIDSLINLSIEYSYTNEDTCLIIGRRSVEISKAPFLRSIHAKALLELGDSYRIFGNLEEGEKLIQEGKAIYEELEDIAMVAYADNKLGALNQDKGDLESAINYYLSALATAEELKDSSTMLNTSINTGIIFYFLNRTKKAVEYTDKALQLTELMNNPRSKIFALNNQGNNYNQFADQYFKQSESNPLKSDLYKDSAQYYLNKSLEYHKQSLAFAKKENNNVSVLRSMINISEIKNTQGDYNETVKIALEAEESLRNLGDITLLILNKQNLLKAYHQLGQTKKAIKYGEEALKIATDNAMEGYISSINGRLYLSYRALGQYNEALKKYEAHIEYEQKNQNAEKNKAIADVETRYQTVKKEKQILQQENDIMELEKTNAKVLAQRNNIIGGTLFFGLFSFLGFRFMKVRKERNEKIAFAEALIFAQEEERKRIARDLHDGVGQSLLLIKKQIASNHETTLENQQLISDTLEEVRSISRDLHPFQLEKFGLTTAINDTILKVEKSTDLFITKEIENIDGMVSKSSEIHIFRAVQESLNNVVKHAQASAAKVSIQSVGNEIEISIMDNGKGFDHELMVINSKSLGLRTMHERLASIGGEMKIEQNEPSGTRIIFKVPKV